MPSLDDWQVESLRFTVFTNELAATEWGDLWPSKAALNERREQPSLRSVTQTGTYERWLLTVQTQLERADFTIAANLPNGLVAEFPNAGGFDEVTAVLRSLVPRDFGKRIGRVAFGAVLLNRVQDHESAYKRLGGYLPGLSIDPKSRDFFYQINKPRPSADKWPELNRVFQWAAVKSVWMLNPNEQPGKTLDIYAVRLVLDVNTSAESSLSIGSEIDSDLLDILVTQGRQMAATGDL